jgi:ribosomal protein S18 acetylase RimI-like enzyme
MAKPLQWRPAALTDIGDIARLSLAHLGPYAEGEEVFAERIGLAPEGCFVLIGNRGIVGYFCSHPWIRQKPPALHQMLCTIPPEADCWYVHDVAVDPSARGGGVVAEVCERAFAVAADKGFRTAMLVAVSGAGNYWAKLGFKDMTTEALRAKLKDYGDDALYMERNLSGD